MSEDLLREELHRLVDPLQPSPGAFDAVRRQRAARRRWRVMVPIAVAGATATALVGAVVLLPGDPAPTGAPTTGPLTQSPTESPLPTDPGEVTESPTPATTATTTAADDEAPAVELTETAWSGTLPTDHPTRFVANYENGIALFAADDGRLLDTLVTPPEGCRLALQRLRPSGDLDYRIFPRADDAEGDGCSFDGPQFSWHPDRGSGTIHEEDASSEAFAAARSVRIFDDWEMQRSTVWWLDEHGDEAGLSPYDTQVGSPALSADGRLALITYDAANRLNPLVVLPWASDSLADGVRIRTPGGPECSLTAPEWIDSVDSTGASAQLLLAIRRCGDDTTNNAVLMDPARAELLWVGPDIPVGEFGIGYVDWWGGALLYQPEAGDTIGPVRTAVGDEFRVLDTRHPTDDRISCSSIDPAPPCASSPIWVPDDWG